MLNIIFPMAGEATRFGGEFKPFIKTGDMSFIERAVEPFLNHISDIDKFYFIITEEQNLSNNVEAVLNRMFDVSIEVVVLKNKTTGPYQTIRSALNALSDKIQGEILICDCDHSIDVDYIFDKIESSIPKLGIIDLEDKENKFKKWINTSSKEFQELTNNIYVNQPQEFKKQLNKIGITYLKIDSKENYIKNLIKLFKYRKKQK